MADITELETKLRNAVARHADAVRQRDEAAAEMQATAKAKAELEAQRADILRRPLGRGDQLVDVEVAIGETDDKIVELRANLRTVAPLVATSAAEVVRLRTEALETMAIELTPVRQRFLDEFAAAAVALGKARADLDAVDRVTRTRTLSFDAVPPIRHPVTGVVLTDQPSTDADEAVRAWQGIAEAIRAALGVTLPAPAELAPAGRKSGGPSLVQDIVERRSA